jgi:alcohol dehydrogenase YqhD (iron-dependent ADH family)
MRFEFASAARIIFGPGAVREVARAARALGQRALLVTGR